MSAAPRHLASPPPSAALRSLEALWLARGVTGGPKADPLETLRAQAMQRVLELGLPTSRDETWRYTQIRPLLARTFVAAPGGAASDVDPAQCLLDAPGRAATVVVLNGRPILNEDDAVAFNGIEINSIRNISRNNPGMLTALLSAPSDADDARWALINTALFSDGVHLRITARIEEPLVIQQVLRSDDPNGIAHPRVFIEMAPGASATVLEHYVHQGAHPPLGNSVTEIALGRNARLEHYRVFSTGADAEHIDSLTVRQDGHSHCRQFTAVMGGGLVRTGLQAHLNQAGAEIDCHSLLVGHAARQVDCVNVAVHAARDTRSRQTARAIASGTSRVVFNTKVVVDRGAVHAESEQSFRGLILSPSAEIDSRPQLEIHADEVKCAHGATTGRLNPDMLFYLLSRGLDRATAQTLLVYAFLSDVLTGMSVASARKVIETALISQLPDSNILDKFR